MGPSTRVLGYIKQARFPFSSLSIGVKIEKERGKKKEKSEGKAWARRLVARSAGVVRMYVSPTVFGHGCITWLHGYDLEYP